MGIFPAIAMLGNTRGYGLMAKFCHENQAQVVGFHGGLVHRENWDGIPTYISTSHAPFLSFSDNMRIINIRIFVNNFSG